MQIPLGEIVSTRKVKNDSGQIFIDLKLGDLLHSRVVRLRTNNALEIGRLLRNYITVRNMNGE